jgi:hypothetical protein
MRREVKTYHVSCDYCGTSQIVFDVAEMPKGWLRIDAMCHDKPDWRPNGYKCLKDWCGTCKEGMVLERR